MGKLLQNRGLTLALLIVLAAGVLPPAGPAPAQQATGDALTLIQAALDNGEITLGEAVLACTGAASAPGRKNC
jgi:hypothetical protein